MAQLLEAAIDHENDHTDAAFITQASPQQPPGTLSVHGPDRGPGRDRGRRG